MLDAKQELIIERIYKNTIMNDLYNELDIINESSVDKYFKELLKAKKLYKIIKELVSII